MVPLSQLQEFGFDSERKFPQYLVRHTVTLSLPTALERGIPPLDVVIEDGLVIPQQAGGSSGGMLIKSDGTMLYIAHRDALDPASPLEARFVKEIPFDARIEASNIMRRAVAADPSLGNVWTRISAAWTAWFPPLEGAGTNLQAGAFDTIAGAWNRMGDLLGRLIDQVSHNLSELESARVKFVVQSGREFRKGWQGEEIVADETALAAIVKMERTKYLLQVLFPRLQKILRDPVFAPDSRFHVHYGSRRTYLIRLLVTAADSADAAAASAAGIEFTLSDLDGFSPSIE